ncbi:MAG: UvrD-helicase domain-containing protein [Tidjanibacter sp.]|nr:UvrD-helicase domain-containing protein [Tidjanibacter sp.]
MGKVEILSASAGSGKTFRLALKYICTLLDEPYNYRHILAVTFTNKATDELKGRILSRLNSLAKGEECDLDEEIAKLGYTPEEVRKQATLARNLILHDYNNFAVMTIDKFFQRVMRAFIKEIGVDLNFSLELKSDTILDEAADLMLEQVSEDKSLYKWVSNYIGDNISDGSTWNIKKGITSLGKELFKEEYKHSRISAQDKPELESIIATFIAQGKKAVADYKAEAKKFVALMDSHGLTAGDFKGGARSGVATYIQKVAAGEVVAPTPAALNALGGEWHKAGKLPSYSIIDSLAGEFGRIVARLVEIYPATAIANNNRKILSAHYRDFALLADLRTRIEQICQERDILPISDVGELIAALVADNDAPFIYEKAGNRYDYYMIDEFQDTSTMQWNNFVPLLHNAVAQSAGSPVLLVGDVKQSIYRWRGGDWSLLAYDVHRAFEEVTSENLDVNRRSSREVVEFNNNLTEFAVGSVRQSLGDAFGKARDGGFITSTLADQLSSMVGTAYKDHAQNLKKGVENGYVTVLGYDKKEEAIHPAIRRIEELQQRGYRASDIAVLVRTNNEASEIATEILKYKNNPQRDQRYIFDVVTQEALAISASSAVRFVIATMTLATNPDDKVAKALYNGYFERPYQEALSTEEEDFIRSLALLQPEETFNELMLHFPNIAPSGEIPYLQALHNQIITYCSSNIADTALFVKWWNDHGASESVSLPKDTDAITIMTIHKSKGLGFNAVIIPYGSWSLSPKTNSIFWAQPNEPLSERITRFPVSYNSDMAESIFSHSYYQEMTLAAIDSLNTLYVAVTRAVGELHIFVPSKSGVGTIIADFVELKEGEMYELGKPITFKAKERTTPSLSTFNTHSPSQKIAVRYNHQRYDEESEGTHLAPRDYGIVMHRAMEQAITREDIEYQLTQGITDGIISADEAEEVGRQINKALEDPCVAEWFDGSWEEVHGERDIIEGGRSWRPDRVMTRGSEAVVVDYKFGLAQSDTHRQQIERYASLLQGMGYTSVRCYLWYISLEQVVQVV